MAPFPPALLFRCAFLVASSNERLSLYLRPLLAQKRQCAPKGMYLLMAMNMMCPLGSPAVHH